MFRLLRLIAGLIGLLGLIVTAVVALVPGNRTPPSAWIQFFKYTESYQIRPDGSDVQQITVYPDWDSSSSSPGQDGYLFEKRSGGNEESADIYRRRADGTEQLTTSPKYDGFPAWSPDGQWIAFVSGRDGNWEIYRMRPNGSDQQNLTVDPDGEDRPPKWSPDGQWIVYESYRYIEQDSEIYRMRADGSEKQNLTQNPARDDTGPVWSQDGRWIAFVAILHDQSRDADIYRMKADGSQQQRLTTNPNDELFPEWSPDGQWIAYEAISNYGFDIYRMRANGSEQQRLTYDEKSNGNPHWSPPLHRSWHPWRLIAAWAALLVLALAVPRVKFPRKINLR